MIVRMELDQLSNIRGSREEGLKKGMEKKRTRNDSKNARKRNERCGNRQYTGYDRRRSSEKMLNIVHFTCWKMINEEKMMFRRVGKTTFFVCACHLSFLSKIHFHLKCPLYPCFLSIFPSSESPWWSLPVVYEQFMCVAISNILWQLLFVLSSLTSCSPSLAIGCQGRIRLGWAKR